MKQDECRPHKWVLSKPLWLLACCWGELDGSRLILVPSPLSPVQTRLLRYPQDAEVIGRVTGVAMQIAALQTDTPDDVSGAGPTA